MNEPQENNDKVTKRFIRWQGITITQLSYSINLILTFSLAFIGFIFTLLIDETQPKLCLYFVALGFLSFSVVFGICCTITRLIDFRKTAEKINLKRKNEDLERRKYLKSLTEKLGKWTWRIFLWQIGAFSLGFIFLVLSVFF